MRIPYYCPYCDQRSTRRWNLDVHIKRRHGGYLLGSSSDQYMANNPPLYNKSVQLGHATVADTSFQSRYMPQQAPLEVSQYSTSPMQPPRGIMDDRRSGIGLSQETKRKIDELTRLMNKYPQFHTNLNGIIRWAINGAVKGDNQFLDEKLEQLRIIDFYNG